MSLSNSISGDCTLTNMVDGQSGVFMPIYPESYTGEYTITPTAEAQVLATDHLVMAQNVIINPIPSNYGLITWNGSTLTVS